MIRYGIPPGLTGPEETKNWRGDDVPDPREISNLSPEKAARPVLSDARRRTTVVGSHRDVSRGERRGVGGKRGHGLQIPGASKTRATIDPAGFGGLDPTEPQDVSRARLADPVQVGRDDVGDVRITPHGPARHPEDHRPPSRDLDRAGGDRGGDSIG